MFRSEQKRIRRTLKWFVICCRLGPSHSSVVLDKSNISSFGTRAHNMNAFGRYSARQPIYLLLLTPCWLSLGHTRKVMDYGVQSICSLHELYVSVDVSKQMTIEYWSIDKSQANEFNQFLPGKPAGFQIT